MEFIGKGEITAVKLLQRHFGEDTVIKTQVKLTNMLDYDWRNEMSDRQKKETLDIVVMRKSGRPLVVRVQDKHHTTPRMSHIDKSQEFSLLQCGCDVVDIWYYECPHIFKEQDCEESMMELLTTLQETSTYK